MTCNCDDNVISKATILDAVEAQIDSDGDNSYGVATGQALKRQALAAWAEATGGIGTAPTFTTPGTATPVNVTRCYLSALLDYLRSLAVCMTITDPQERAACVSGALSLYDQAIAACDAM